jgi:hypothetical protein
MAHENRRHFKMPVGVWPLLASAVTALSGCSGPLPTSTRPAPAGASRTDRAPSAPAGLWNLHTVATAVTGPDNWFSAHERAGIGTPLSWWMSVARAAQAATLQASGGRQDTLTSADSDGTSQQSVRLTRTGK